MHRSLAKVLSTLPTRYPRPAPSQREAPCAHTEERSPRHTLSLPIRLNPPLLCATELKMCCGWGETITRTQHFKKGGGGFTETLRRRLVAVASELLGDRGGVGGGLEGSNLGLLGRDLALVERSGLDLPLLLEAVDDVAVRPAELVRDALWTTTSWSAVGKTSSVRSKKAAAALTLMAQYLRPGFRRRTRSAEGTTTFFLRS